MTFLHMHHAMANKAMMLEAIANSDYWKVNKPLLRDIVMSGKVDYRGETVTDEDRELVCKYLNV